jgi:hypothetical protein
MIAPGSGSSSGVVARGAAPAAEAPRAEGGGVMADGADVRPA